MFETLAIIGAVVGWTVLIGGACFVLVVMFALASWMNNGSH